MPPKHKSKEPSVEELAPISTFDQQEWKNDPLRLTIEGKMHLRNLVAERRVSLSRKYSDYAELAKSYEDRQRGTWGNSWGNRFTNWYAAEQMPLFEDLDKR